MRWSDERILTTHTGSLPRPPELTRLYVRRARGETIDSAELDRIGKMALRRIVDKQIEAGVDIGNNGEQRSDAKRLRRAVHDRAVARDHCCRDEKRILRQ
jgi:5-methyltetrahydropteroyltriglutamate--homocysteine methyltransferase